MKIRFNEFVVWQQDMGGAAAAAAAPAATPAAAPPIAPAGNGSDPIAGALPPLAQAAAKVDPPPGPYYPEGLPDSYRGKDERETLDKLAKEIVGRPKPPEKPEAYEYSPSDAFKQRYGDLKDDPVMGMWRKVSHELGLDNAKFNQAYSRLYELMSAEGLIEEPLNVQAELAKLRPVAGDTAQRDAAAQRRVNEVVAWTRGLAERGGMKPEQAAEIAKIAATANGVMAIEALMSMASERGLRIGGTPTDSLTDHERALRTLYPTMNKVS